MQQAASLIAALIAGLLLLAPLSGCNSIGDPYDRTGTWASTGVNEANLREMVSDPRDLALGRGDERALAVEAVPPVGRLLTGNRLPLSTESASGIGSTTQTQSATTSSATQGAGSNAGQ